MPVKRRKDKRRAGEVEAWCGYLRCGFDFFNELAAVGLTEDTAYDVAEVTWHRIGADAMAYHRSIYEAGYPYEDDPWWAAEEFGPPGRKRRAGR